MSCTKEWIIGTNKKDGKSVLDCLLESRGIKGDKAKEEFLNPLSITLMHPNAFCEMQKAVGRICKAIDEKENILIYGDFDADGVTSTSVLVKTLSYLGGVVDYYIPDRDTEGHGLNTKSLVKLLTQKKPKLVITVDNGISSVEEVKFINSFGRDVIITDHHEAPDEVPSAYAIINPKAMNALDEKLTPSQIESMTSLAGVGVAFKLAQAVLEKYEKLEYSYELLPFVAVGTIADIVPLIGENRYYVTKGLELIANGKHYGLKRMLDTAGIGTENGLTAEQVAFTIAPRINASGRLDSVDAAIKVMISENKQEIELAIMQLENFNKLRQEMCARIFEEADEIWKKSGNRDNAIVLFSKDWHIGIIGIVASKFVEKYYKPTFIMNYNEESKLFRCSARGVKELNLYDIISNISEYLEGYGGHKLAAGFTFTGEKVNFETVKKALNQTIDEMLNGKKLVPSLDIDMEISMNDIDVSLVEELSKLEPYGASNPSPAFVINNLTLKQKKLMGSTKEHLKLSVEGPNGLVDCVWWSRGDIPLVAGDKLDIAFAPQINVFNGVTSVQLVLKDVHSDVLKKESDTKQKVYDHRKKTNILSQVNDYIKNSKLEISVFVEDRSIQEGLKPYKSIVESIINRNTASKADVLMFFDYPADADILEDLLNKVAPKALHYMSYQTVFNREKYEEDILKTFSGMIKYTCNNQEGNFKISRAASALGITDAAVEVLLEMFEDAGMIKILKREETEFCIKFVSAIEFSKTMHTQKYAEFVEIMNTIIDYKKHFSAIELETLS
ncbi:single-stranded-DNA-specific exonuclease RecJ [bacterium]|nr:single-stranded-DNA-specific exonuclease RecJ [bacterium]